MAIEPVTREERFLAAAGGRSVTPPAPITRKEQLLQGIIDAVKSGGASPDVIEGAVNDYLNDNPVQPGATTEQAAQIEQNKTDIADLQTEVDELKESSGGSVDLTGVVRSVNGKTPDEKGNVEIDVSGSGQNVDLTGYAKESWVQEGFQPKGNYLTEVPEGYAKTADIPTKPDDIGAQPAGSYLTDETDPTVPSWAKQPKKPTYTASEVGARPADWMPTAQEVGALPSTTVIPAVPTKVSAFTNDAGYLTEHQDISSKLDADKLPEAVEDALAQAKASGAFNGKDGSDATVTAENIAKALGYVPVGAGTDSPLTGKKIVYDGDSICAAAFGYPKLIADKTACIFDNQAVGGARLCAVSDKHSVVNNLANLPTDGDIYCFEGGINDWWANTPVGTYTQGDYTGAVDATTIYGAMETICRYALTNFFGKAICFVIVHKVQNSAYSQNTAGHTFWDYRKAMIDVCEKYSIPYYDAFTKSGLNGWNAAQKAGLFVSGDGTHPTEAAYEAYYVPQLISLFESIVPVGDYEAPAKPVTYTNVLRTKTVDANGNPYNDGKGYKEDTYLNGSGVEQSSTYYDVTGFIECGIGDVFRLKNVQFCKNVNGNSKCQIQYYKADKSLMSVTGYCKDPTGLSEAWQAVTNDAGTDIIQFTVPTALNATLSYIRLCCGTLTDASVITINEEIE